MSKTESDGLKKISVAFLNKHKYFIGYRGGTINWTSEWSENKSSVGISVSTSESFLRIHYTQTDYYSDEKKDFDYKIPLTTTPCNYGGSRYWFTCPWYKNGNYCGKRVGVLYKNGDYFACRHCYNLTYSSRNLSGISKLFGRVTAPDVDKAHEKVKLAYYRGKPTRKYLRYLKMEEKFENAFIGMANLMKNKVRLSKG